jgi:hypothetical protein
MAISTFSSYVSAISQPTETVYWTIPQFTSIAGRTFDTWTVQAPQGAAPTTAVAPTRATAGALGQQNGNAVLGAIAGSMNSLNPGVYMVCDRLSHQGGLSGTVTGAQTTNLPTAALTRYTDGVGVMCMLSIYTQIGSTATTVSVSYTNEQNVSAKTSPLVVFGGTGFREVGRGVLIPSASGDSGFRAVASVTITATTGTAGAFGVTLFKPLVALIVDEQHGVTVNDLITGRIGGGLPEIVDDACLFMFAVSQSIVIQGAGTILTEDY